MPFCVESSYAQDTNQLSSGNTQRTTVSFTNTFGVYSQLNVTPNVSGTVSGSLNVEPGSSVKSDFGANSDSLKQVVNITPTSSSVTIDGMKSSNDYRIAPGTSFSTDLKTLTSAECSASESCKAYKDGPANGSAGSGMQHAMTLTIEQTTSSFSNSFSQKF